LQIADKGVEEAVSGNPVLAKGLSTLDGELLSEPVGEAHELPYADANKLLN
jgi:alanine dehydrogenase